DCEGVLVSIAAVDDYGKGRSSRQGDKPEEKGFLALFGRSEPVIVETGFPNRNDLSVRNEGLEAIPILLAHLLSVMGMDPDGSENPCAFLSNSHCPCRFLRVCSNINDEANPCGICTTENGFEVG
ncbi:unnamed protein product, partial [marine sediment metagenome]